MTENDDTPPIRLAPEDGPAAYLRQEPTAREHALAESVGRRDGDAVPFHMFAKVVIRQEEQGRWIGQADGFWRKIRRHARAVAVMLATNLTVVGGYAVHRIAATAIAEERALQLERASLERRDAQEREIRDLRLDIRALWTALHRLSGIEPPPNSDIDVDDPGVGVDKFSSIGRPASQFGTPASTAPASIGGGPNGSIGCWRQRPELQNTHVPPNCLHSELLVQKLRHPPCGLGVGVFDGGCEELLQAAIATANASDTMWCIPHL